MHEGIINFSSRSFYDESKRRNWSLETFGLCGAGKTTLLRHLFVALQEVGTEKLPTIEMPVQPDWESVLYQTSKVVARAIRASPRETSRFLGESGAWWLPQKLGYRIAGIKLRRTMSAPMLIDSGMLQPFVSFAIERNVDERHTPTNAFLSAVVLPSVALYTDAQPDVAYQRYVDREVAAGRALPIGNLRKRFDHAYQVCQLLCSRYDNSPKKLIRIDASKEWTREVLDDLARQVLEHIWTIEGEMAGVAA